LKRTSYDAPHYEFFSSITPIPHSFVHILSSAHFLKYHKLLVRETKFHTHTKQEVKLCFHIFSCKFLEMRKEDKHSELNGSYHSSNLN